MAGYNRTRYVEELLERTDALPPSFTVHLHLEYWTLNNGSKFLYHNQIASLLDDIRAHRIPVDFLELFEAAKVPFYDGCMIVELLDYRPQRNKEPTPEKPERTRVVLHPNAETIWADICSLNQKHGGKWSDRDALDVEARLLLAISPPLCLNPNPHLTRIANHVMRVSTPTVPVSLKRKAAAMDPEEDETEKARRAKIMQFMNPRHNRTYTPTYRILDALQNARLPKPGSPQPQVNGNQFMATSQQSSPTKASTPSESYSHAQSPSDSEDKKPVPVGDAPQTSFATFTRPNGTHTPAPVPATHHQFISQNPPSLNPTPSPGKSPMQPQVYPSVQAATEAAMRTSTPAQQHYQPSRPPSSQPAASSHPTPQPQPQHLVPQPQPQPQSQPQSQPHSQSQPMYQPVIPNQPFATSPLAGVRNGSASPTKAGNNYTTNNNSNNTNSNTTENTPAFATPQSLYSQQMQQLQLAQVMQQRLSGAGGGGRSTPNHPHAHTSQSQSQSQVQAPSPARGSPRTTIKPLGARRSPLPLTAQPVASHPQQPPPPSPQQQHLAFAAQYSGHLRPPMHGGSSQQTTSPHVTNANGNGNVNGTRRTGTASPLPPQAPDASLPAQQPQLHPHPPHQPHIQHGFSPLYGYAQVNYPTHAQAQQAQARANYWQMGMAGRPGMIGVGGPGMMGPGQPVVVGGPGKGGTGVPGR